MIARFECVAVWLTLVTVGTGCSCSNLTIVPGDGGLDAGIDAGVDAGTCDRLFFDGGGTVIATGLARPRRLGIGGGPFLYVSLPGVPLQGNGQLIRVPLDGGATTPVLSNLESPEAVGLSPTAIYVVEAGGVWRIDQSGATVAQLNQIHTGSIFGGTDIEVIGEDAIVATASRWLERVVPDGGATTLLYGGDAGASTHSAVVENGDVFFLVAEVPEGGIYKVPADGSRAATRLTANPAYGSSLAVTPTDFVWSEGGNGAGMIRRSPRDGGIASTVASGLCNPTRVRVVGSVVYFKDSTACGAGTGSQAFLQQASLCSTEAGPLGPVGSGPGDVVIRGDALFFTSEAASDAGFIGSL